MRLRHTILALSTLFAATLMAQENDELGIWSEVGIEKAITKNWDVGLDLEYRAQNKARFSAGLGTSYKVNKYLKFGVNYSFLYSEKPDKCKNKDEGEEFSEEGWRRGYNFTPDYWYPRHRFSVEATGSIKPWKWLKVSLRERYQLTHCKTRNVEKYVYREVWGMAPRFEEGEDEWDLIYIGDFPEMYGDPTDEWRIETKPAYNDQVLRSRLKFEYDKKRFPFSPYISAELHNSVGRGDHMLLQKIRTAIGSGYKFRKHNEISLSYIITFDMFDIEEDEISRETVRLHDRLHTINIGYKYSF